MKMKKTWFSYLLWLLYMAGTGILLATYVTTVSVNAWGLSKYVAAGAVCLSFALSAGIWLVGRKVLSYAAVKLAQDKHLADMWECFLAMCLFAAALLYRINFLFHTPNLSVVRSRFYEWAQVTGSGELPNITHGASYFYTAVLSLVFSFIGNKIFAGIILQVILQLFAMLFFYFALRVFSGRVVALASLCLMAFSPALLKSMCILSPQDFYLFCFAVGLWAIALYGKRRGAAYFFLVLIGVLIAVLTYLDRIGLTLLFFAVIYDVMRVQKKGNISKKLLSVLLLVLTVAFSFLGILLWDAVFSAQSFGQIFQAWLFPCTGISGAGFAIAGPESQPFFGLAVCFAAAIGIVGFWGNKESKIEPWVLLLLSVIIIEAVGIGSMEYSLFRVFIWSVLAGLGADSMRISIEPETLLPEELQIEEITEDKPQIKYIENPLPLPKPHIKKEMGYGVEPSEAEMDFDVHIKENDDFDI